MCVCVYLLIIIELVHHFTDRTRKDGLWTAGLVRPTIRIEINVTQRFSEAQGCESKNINDSRNLHNKFKKYFDTVFQFN